MNSQLYIIWQQTSSTFYILCLSKIVTLKRVVLMQLESRKEINKFNWNILASCLFSPSN